MQLTLRQQLTQFAHVLQSQLFPAVEQHIGELDDTARRLSRSWTDPLGPLYSRLPQLDRTPLQRPVWPSPVPSSPKQPTVSASLASCCHFQN